MPADTVVLYHYFEASEAYASNLAFFLDHGAHPSVDCVVLISGGCSLALPILDNVRYVHLPNRGFDFGAYAVGLASSDLRAYRYFVFVNCTVRGPFLLPRDPDNWTEVFTGLLGEDVKLVGTTVNILPGGNDIAEAYERFAGRGPPFPHVQSMAFAVDRDAMELLRGRRFFSAAPDAKADVVAQSEIHMSQIILARGWNIACLAPDYRGIDFRTVPADVNPTSRDGDPWFAGSYFGRSLHPYETVFFKTNRAVRPPEEIESLSRSQAGRARPRRALPPLEQALGAIRTAWSGHKLFARWLMGRMRPEVVVDLGVDYGFSTLCFASACGAEVFGVDSFEGDAHAGFRDTHAEVVSTVAALGLGNVRIVKGYFGDVAASWDRPVDVLHVDGRHDYASVREDHSAWKGFVRGGGAALFHDTCVPGFGVRRYFDEIEGPKLNFRHSAGLGVASRDAGLIAEIAEVFGSLVEPGSVRL